MLELEILASLICEISLFDVFKQLLTLHKLTQTSDTTSINCLQMISADDTKRQRVKLIYRVINAASQVGVNFNTGCTVKRKE